MSEEKEKPLPLQSPAVKAGEYLAMKRGIADQETRERVSQALGDPSSELNGWLNGISRWADRAFDPVPFEPIATRERQMIEHFIAAKKSDGRISDEQALLALQEGRKDSKQSNPSLPGPDDLIESSGEIREGNKRMIEKLLELAPHLADEIRSLRDSKERARM